MAAIKITPMFGSKPSNSTNSWFSVCSRSSCPPTVLNPRAFPSASSSSMKMMQGALSFACLNRSLTRAAPNPTNISTNSEPLRLKNGTLPSPATALAKSVFPVPGGPTKRIPRGICPPIRVNRSGSFRKSIISTNSCLASSTPAASSKLT